MSTPRTPPRSRRRTLLLPSFALAALSVGAFGGAAPASANEFPPKPTAQATFLCDPNPDPDLHGAVLTVLLGNTAGLDTAHFTVERTDVPDATYDVAVGETAIARYHDMLPENGDVTVTVTADPNLNFTETFHVDCTDFVGGVVLNCDGDQPVITANATAIGQLGDEGFLADGGDDVEVQHLEPGESVSFTHPVPNDVPFEIELLSDADGVIADLVGTPHCETPTTSTTVPETPTTVPDPTIPEPTVPEPTVPDPTVPEPITPEPAEVPTTNVAPIPVPAGPQVLPADVPAGPPTALPRTGSSTVPLTASGFTLLGLGILLRRAARRAIG